LLPAVEITPVPESEWFQPPLLRLDELYAAVFVSANAASVAVPVLLRDRPWPPELRVLAIGAATAARLADLGVTSVLCPLDRYDSEGLLALPALADVAQRQIAIVRGRGGRDVLRTGLLQRGAQVLDVACYERRIAKPSPQQIDAIWRDGIDFCTVTSVEVLSNLFQLMGPARTAALCQVLMFAPHARIAAAARLLGVRQVIETAPGDDGLLAAMIAHHASTAQSGAAQQVVSG
jgi:uroporphyrinogen-III synthase